MSLCISYGFAAFFTSFAILAFSYFFFQRWLRRRYRLPPGPLPLPLIGSLHLLGALTHQSFASLAKSYGPLMFLRLGSIPALVISSASLAREVLSTQDRIFASRPRVEAGCLFYDHLNVGFSPYGHRWRQLRRVYTLNIFTMKKIDSFQNIRAEEMSFMLRSIIQVCQEGKAVNLRPLLSTLAANTMMRLLMSQRFPSDESGRFSELRHNVAEAFRLSGVAVISDFMPYLRWLDLDGNIKRMKEVNKFMDVFLEGVINDTRKSRKENPNKADNGHFLEVLLSIADDESADIGNEELKAIILELLGAIEWAMAEMVRKSLVLRKVQEDDRLSCPAFAQRGVL